MIYRVTYSSPAGANRVVCTDAAEAIAVAKGVLERGLEDVWIGDLNGTLFTLQEFELLIGAT